MSNSNRWIMRLSSEQHSWDYTQSLASSSLRTYLNLAFERLVSVCGLSQTTPYDQFRNCNCALCVSVIRLRIEGHAAPPGHISARPHRTSHGQMCEISAALKRT